MRQLKLIGIGAGNPDYLTLQAIRALQQVDVIFLTDKGHETADLLRARRDLCDLHMGDRPYRLVDIIDPKRNRTAAEYRAAVDAWHEQRAAAYEGAIATQLSESECGAFLVWGDPSLYDSALRIVERVLARGNIAFEYEIIPGITSVQALAARHKIPLNDIGDPVRITTGRRFADAPSTADGTVVVMLDGIAAYQAVSDKDTEIYWGAYLGTPDELLIAGSLADVSTAIDDARAEARKKKGWIMDTYLLRRPR